MRRVSQADLKLKEMYFRRCKDLASDTCSECNGTGFVTYDLPYNKMAARRCHCGELTKRAEQNKATTEQQKANVVVEHEGVE